VHETESGLRQPQDVGESPLLALLRAYRDLVELRTPRVAWIRRGRGLGGIFRTPSLRWVVNYFVVAHVKRTIAALERRYAMQLAVGEAGPTERAELERIREFRQALPRVLIGGVAITSVFTAVSSFGLAALKRLADAVDLNDRLMEVHAYVAESNSAIEEAALGLMLTPLALAIVAAPVVASFRLKRGLFNGYPAVAANARQPASEYDARSTGVYELERAAFERVHAPPPKEFPLDLAVVALPIASVVAVYVGLGTVVVDDREAGGGLIFVVWLALSAMLVGAVIAHKRRVARERVTPGLARARTSAPASIRTRARAQLADLPPLFGICIPLWVAVAAIPRFEGDPEWIVAMFVVPPAAGALYTTLSLADPSRRHGASFGKNRRAIAVVRRDGADAERWRLVFRESVLKWGFLGPASLGALFVPAVLNVLWAFLDRENRALHDVVAGTVVIQVEPQPVLAAEAEHGLTVQSR
jgi:uncharacterized RDD family membrane protein YckC